MPINSESDDRVEEKTNNALNKLMEGLDDFISATSISNSNDEFYDLSTSVDNKIISGTDDNGKPITYDKVLSLLAKLKSLEKQCAEAMNSSPELSEQKNVNDKIKNFFQEIRKKIQEWGRESFMDFKGVDAIERIIRSIQNILRSI